MKIDNFGPSMKRNHILVTLLLIITSFSATAQNRVFHFVQNGDTVKAVKGVVKLKKDSFELHATILDNDVFIVNMGTDSSNLIQLKKGASVDTMHCFGIGTGMSGYRSNKKKCILVKSTDNNYWGYIEMRKSTDFDKNKIDGDSIHVVRTVNNLFFIESNLKKDCKVKEMPVSSLYLVYYLYYDLNDDKRIRTEPIGLEIQFVD